MKTFLTPLLACALSAIPSSLFAQFQVGDDFTDPVRDVSKWGAADVGTGDADWVESNGRMNLVAASPSFVGSFVQRQWDGRSPGYSADWQAGVDVELGSLELFAEQVVGVGLSVMSAVNPGQGMRLTFLALQSEAGFISRRLQLDVFDDSGAVVGSIDQAFSSRSAKLRFTYDANSRMLLAGSVGADGTVQLVGGFNTSLWGMNDASEFDLIVGATTIGASVSSGQVTADNFAINQQVPRTVSSLQEGDDFNDNLRDAAKWGRYDAVYGVGQLDEVGGAMQYSTLGASGLLGDQAARRWFPGAGDMSQPWTAQLDVSLPTVVLQEGQQVEVGLEVLNLADPGDRVTCAFNLRNVAEQSPRSFQGAIQRDGQPFSDMNMEASTASVAAALRLRWEPATTQLHLEYDANGAVGGYSWTSLGHYSVNAGDSSWELGSASRFQVGIYGQSVFGAEVPLAANVRLDNFQLTGGTVTLPPVKITDFQKAPTKLSLKWEGGKGPFQVQSRGVVSSGVWSNVGSPVTTRAATVDTSSPQGYLRILDLGQ